MRKRFRIDARAILTWGRESIRDHSTAILELVKNGYDAGARVVEVNIAASSEQPEDRFITITDDGEGMNEDDIDTKWLRIGYSSKREQTTTRKGRRKTGEKGIGRISADRLGAVLELRTQRKGFPAIGLKVNWSRFEASGVNVDKIPIARINSPKFRIPRPAKLDDKSEEWLHPPNSRPNSNGCSGSQLKIRGLRDTWKASEIKELRTALSALTPPFGGGQDFQIRLINDLDPECNGVIESPFYKTAELEFTCSIDSQGTISSEFIGRSTNGKKLKPKVSTYQWSEFVHQAELTPEAAGEEPSITPHFGPTKVKLLFFPRRMDTLRGTDLLMSDLREFLDQNAGIKVYRDNIRVSPYGDPKRPEGDWLGLGERKVRNPAGAGRPDYRVSPNQLVGAVYITRDENEQIADTSSREGLVHSDSFYQMKAFILGCIVQLESNYHQLFLARQAEARTMPPPREVVGTLRQRLRTLADSLDEVKNEPTSRKAERALEMIQSTTADLRITEQSLEELASQAIVYRSLATLGIAASTFGHETLGSIEGVGFAISTAMDELRGDDPDIESAMEELEKGLKFTARISAWGKFALGRVKRDKRRRRNTDVRKIVRDLVDEIKIPFEGSSISISLALRPCNGRVFPMDVEAVVLNLLTNAYFFAKKSEGARHIRIELRSKEQDEKIGFQLIVADSGPGVPSDRKEQIWEPLYSTKVDSKGRTQGTGLGLAIIDSVVQDASGWRSVDSDPILGGAKFDIWLPLG